jgi:hypothetical protein
LRFVFSFTPRFSEVKRLDNAVRHIFTVPKEDVLKEEGKQKRARAKKPIRRKAVA